MLQPTRMRPSLRSRRIRRSLAAENRTTSPKAPCQCTTRKGAILRPVSLAVIRSTCETSADVISTLVRRGPMGLAAHDLVVSLRFLIGENGV